MIRKWKGILSICLIICILMTMAAPLTVKAEAKEKTLTVTAKSVKNGKVTVPKGTYSKIVIAKDAAGATVTFKNVTVTTVQVNSGKKATGTTLQLTGNTNIKKLIVKAGTKVTAASAVCKMGTVSVRTAETVTLNVPVKTVTVTKKASDASLKINAAVEKLVVKGKNAAITVPDRTMVEKIVSTADGTTINGIIVLPTIPDDTAFAPDEPDRPDSPSVPDTSDTNNTTETDKPDASDPSKEPSVPDIVTPSNPDSGTDSGNTNLDSNDGSVTDTKDNQAGEDATGHPLVDQDTVTVSFYNGGTLVAIRVMEKGTAIGQLPAAPKQSVQKSGCISGWVIERDGKTEVLTADMFITADTVVQTGWLATVSYMDGNSVIDTETVLYGDTARKYAQIGSNLESSVKEKEFLGWTVQKNAAVTVDPATQPIMAETVYYVKWRERYSVARIEEFSLIDRTDYSAYIDNDNHIVTLMLAKDAVEDSYKVKISTSFYEHITSEDGKTDYTNAQSIDLKFTDGKAKVKVLSDDGSKEYIYTICIVSPKITVTIGNDVTYCMTLAQAADVASSVKRGAIISLADDFSDVGEIYFKNNYNGITLDLNGHTISGASIIVGNGVPLIKGSSSEIREYLSNNTELTIADSSQTKAGTIQGSSSDADVIAVYYGNAVVLQDGVHIIKESDKNHVIAVYGDQRQPKTVWFMEKNAGDTVVTVSDAVVTGGLQTITLFGAATLNVLEDAKITCTASTENVHGFAIGANAAYGTDTFSERNHGTAINVYGGMIDGGTENTGIYLPCDGTVVVLGGTISGCTGIEAAAGQVNIFSDAATISTTLDSVPMDDGSVDGPGTCGYAVALVEKYGSGSQATMTVTGGTFHGPVLKPE